MACIKVTARKNISNEQVRNLRYIMRLLLVAQLMRQQDYTFNNKLGSDVGNYLIAVKGLNLYESMKQEECARRQSSETGLHRIIIT